MTGEDIGTCKWTMVYARSWEFDADDHNYVLKVVIPITVTE